MAASKIIYFFVLIKIEMGVGRRFKFLIESLHQIWSKAVTELTFNFGSTKY